MAIIRHLHGLQVPGYSTPSMILQRIWLVIVVKVSTSGSYFHIDALDNSLYIKFVLANRQHVLNLVPQDKWFLIELS